MGDVIPQELTKGFTRKFLLGTKRFWDAVADGRELRKREYIAAEKRFSKD